MEQKNELEQQKWAMEDGEYRLGGEQWLKVNK